LRTQQTMISGGLAIALLMGVSSQVRAAELEHTMEAMGHAYEAVTKDLKDTGKMTQALADVAKLQAATVTAKGMLPGSVNKMTGDAKVTAAKEYRQMIINLLRAELDLEDAIIDNKADDIKKAMGTIEQIMNAGHEQFIPKKEQKKG
jgi:hypothetical protein